MTAFAVPGQSSVAVAALGWALLDFLWQGALVGCAAAIALMLLRNARPQARYALCCAALGLCLALPAFGLWHGMHAASATNDALASPFVEPGTSPQANGIAPTATGIASPPVASAPSFARSLPWIVAAWSFGAALLAARMALGMMWVANAGRAHGMPHPRWQRRLDRLADKLGIACQVRLRLVAELATPVAAGCWKPVVLVPTALVAQMPLDLLEALLAHELAHVRRHDYLVNLIQSAIEALLFYHPVVWWLSRRIRIEREQIADDLAVAAIGEPHRLALALHELDLYQQRLREAADGDGLAIGSLLPAANGGHLMSRIQRLVRPNPHALNWNIALPIIGLSALCMAVYAHDVHTTTAAAPPLAVAAPAVPARPAPTVIATATAVATASSSPAASHSVTVSHDASMVIRTPNRNSDAYAVVRDGKEGIQMSGDSRDIPAIERLRKTVHGDFIWVRRGDRTYIVQDPGTIAGVLESLKPLEALDVQMAALDAKMAGPNGHMEELNKQMEALQHDNHPYEDAMEKSSTQVDALARQAEALGRKMDELAHRMERAGEAQRDTLERQIQALQAQMEPITRQMDDFGKQMDERGKQFEAAQKPMEDIGRQMEEAAKPMEAIGKQMEALGKQEEQVGREVEQRVQAALDAALRNGKAVPGDGARRE